MTYEERRIYRLIRPNTVDYVINGCVVIAVLFAGLCVLALSPIFLPLWAIGKLADKLGFYFDGW